MQPRFCGVFLLLGMQGKGAMFGEFKYFYCFYEYAVFFK